MTTRREIILNTDWLTAALMAGGMVILLVFIASDLWRIAHGNWGAHSAPPLGRVFETLFCCYALVILGNLCLKISERILRFALGMMSVGLSLHIARMWLAASNPIQYQLSIADNLIELPAFILLATYGVKWFRSKVEHV